MLYLNQNFLYCVLSLLFISSAVHSEFRIQTLLTCDNYLFDEVNHLDIPKIQQGQYPDDTDVISKLDVGYLGPHIVANITWSGFGDVASMYIKLKLMVNGKCEDMKFYTLSHVQSPSNNTESSTNVSLSCLLVPPSPNATLEASMFLLDRKSCDCDVIDERQGRQSCLKQCQIVLVSHQEFPISKEACNVYNQNSFFSNNIPNISFRGQQTSKDMVTFTGFMTNINPFSLVQIWVFTADDILNESIASWEFWPNPTGVISFTKEAISRQHSNFYVKFITNCTQAYGYEVFYSDDIDYEEYKISDPVTTVSPEVSDVSNSPMLSNYRLIKHQHHHYHGGVLFFLQSNPALVYGIVAALVVMPCCVAIIIWIKVSHTKVLACSWSRKENVTYDCEEMYDLQILEPGTSCTNKPTTLNNVTDLDDRNYVELREVSPPVMLIYHANTIEHQGTIGDLQSLLIRHSIQVDDYAKDMKTNWYDFAEMAGTFYPHVIIVLSTGLLELLEIYWNKKPKEPNVPKKEPSSEIEEKWAQLMKERNWNIIPCIVLNQLRMLYYSRRAVFKVHLIKFTGSDEQQIASDICLHTKFLMLFNSFLNSENTVCYTIRTCDLNNGKSKEFENILQLIHQLQSPV